MTNINELVLTGMLTYGAWALGLATLVSAIGVPLPATMLLLAAGAFTRQGVLSWQPALVLAICGAVLGDSGSYLLARFGGAVILKRVQHTSVWSQSQVTFERWGGSAIFLSRFLLTPFALPINLLAGSTHYSLWHYLTLVVTGETLWVIIFGGIGYIFADRWEAVSSLLGDLTGVVVGLVLLIVGGGYLLRSYKNKLPSSHVRQ